MPRIIPAAIDILLVATLLAGLRRSGDFEFATEHIGSPALRWLAMQFLFLGERVLDILLVLTRRYPTYFRPRIATHHPLPFPHDLTAYPAHVAQPYDLPLPPHPMYMQQAQARIAAAVVRRRQSVQTWAAGGYHGVKGQIGHMVPVGPMGAGINGHGPVPGMPAGNVQKKAAER
ncbi:hypothetical protein SpCBS45565_g03019 [Spizellomyces sp. 'palustris']|nr:hypothetical protein SpCBS45565_g03019 [Spizellomyces sp. 'palustris']